MKESYNQERKNKKAISQLLLAFLVINLVCIKAHSQELSKQSGYFLVYSLKKEFSEDHSNTDTVIVYLGSKISVHYQKKIKDNFMFDTEQFYQKIDDNQKIFYDEYSLINLYHENNFIYKISTSFLNTIRLNNAIWTLSKKKKCFDRSANRETTYKFTVSLLYIKDVWLLRHEVKNNVVGCAKLFISDCNEIVFTNKEIAFNDKEKIVYFPIDIR